MGNMMTTAARVGFVVSIPCFLCVNRATIQKGAKENSLNVGIEADGQVNLQGSGYDRRRGTVNAGYGGTTHQDYENDGTTERRNVWRPEVVKSERCDDTACHVCDHPTDDGCWHPGSGGQMDLAVQAGSLFTSFAHEVYFSCPSGSGDELSKWYMQVREITNGKINVYLNNELIEEIEGPVDRPIGESPESFKFHSDLKSNRVRAVFVPSDRNRASSAIARIRADAMDKAADVCMTEKNCLAKLGDGTDAGFELRNNNILQRQCLESGADSFQTSALKEMCSAWVACLPAENKHILMTLLKAARAPGIASFAHEVATSNGTSADPNDCVNPEVDDPESYDCECVEEMIESCEGVHETCFKGIMCQNTQVCQSWKDSVGCAALVQTDEERSAQAGDLNAALGQRSQVVASNGIDEALDGSLQGKCSQ